MMSEKARKHLEVPPKGGADIWMNREGKWMGEKRRVTKAAGVVGGATLLSRILGFVRDMVIAHIFGAGLGSDAFFVAMRVPNLLRRLFAEGSLSIAFIPVFTEYLTVKGREEAFAMARSALRLLSVLLVGVVMLGILLSPVIVRVMAPGFADSPDKLELTVLLTRILFPYTFFICIVALSMGILNALGHFAAPALAPVFLNLGIIFSAVILCPRLEVPSVGLAVGVLIGGVMQLVLQVPFLVSRGFRFWEKAGLRHPGINKVGRLMLPTIFGAAVYQINIIIGTLLASTLPEGSVSYLYYADRLVQFPLALFAISTATAVLPSMSRQVAAGDMEGLSDTFGYGMRLILFITIPAMAGLIVLREPIVRLLLQRGAFDAAATALTADALLYYGIGLWAFSGVRIVVSTFYALSDTKTPVKTAVISIVCNLILALVLMGPLSHGGLALATSLSSVINLLILVYVLTRRLPRVAWGDIALSAIKATIASAIMGGVVYVVSRGVIPPAGGSFVGLGLGVATTIAAGCVVYFLSARLVGSPELASALLLIKKRVKR